MTPSDPIPAATVVILRDRVDGPPEMLMVERARTLAFAGGALVFPGGRVDPGDRALGGDDETAARVAAIRETLEETGVAIGLDPLPPPATLAAIRAALHTGGDFGTLLAGAGIAIRPDLLIPFARWLPSHPLTRVFDTRFYLARLPEDAPAASVDHTENVRLLWTTAAGVIAEAAAGRATLIFPTLRNLERLARFASHAEAVADAEAYPVRTITPFTAVVDGVEHLCIPDDLGYPVVSVPLDREARG
ncbi:NUDIX domain-containing protein [Sphingomonas sp. KR1UV-12]|uniref:NUDIX domain-containing protein n=1 Tax=Sphingomonas aurea TaxID=3063994 RepID=A0ABT9EG69_9SPHN|nr:NUDIX domain-containing protein [Sphingomonas sp. KR1UV-12]MDP1025835.1 NUDIX domain-containing protein [Sphingomonas sp. KR1UV-12]